MTEMAARLRVPLSTLHREVIRLDLGFASLPPRHQAVSSCVLSTADQDEASEAIENAKTILTAAQGLLDQLGLF